jgi:Arc/MetJ-type ribon-helix-helix transcriptional regulator
MKRKISVSLDEKNIALLELLLKEGKFRNKSHALEYGLQELLKEVQNE